ncbi:thrombospondin type-1 domain-containing protein 1-like [Cynocephalus volans]|uniref:thrombospondin type-1 domain-containing protein 1-like n=1 Tax=Cynocephalus volans TaxID=110931 RepID=UPI002FCA13B5
MAMRNDTGEHIQLLALFVSNNSLCDSFYLRGVGLALPCRDSQASAQAEAPGGICILLKHFDDCGTGEEGRGSQRHVEGRAGSGQLEPDGRESSSFHTRFADTRRETSRIFVPAASVWTCDRSFSRAGEPGSRLDFGSPGRLTAEVCLYSVAPYEVTASSRPSSPSPLQPQGPVRSSNLVTVTGISLCLLIIAATVLITLWRRCGRAPECGAAARHGGLPAAGFRKDSDEESICEPRGGLSDSGDAPAGDAGDAGLPLSCRTPGDDAAGSQGVQSGAHKIIPPLFSYRLAQQQLKEMKRKGLTETTKVYHVSQSPLTDTAIDAAAGPPLDLESPEEAAASRFRIRSPFPDQPVVSAGDRPPSRLDFSVSQASCAVSPSQTLIRKSQVRPVGSRGALSERSHPRISHFRRTASFHETKQARPFRERSMSSLTPGQAPAYSSRTRTWDQAGDRGRPHSRGVPLLPEKLEHCPGAGGSSRPLSPLPKSYTLGQPSRKPEVGDRQAGFVAGVERTEPHRAWRGPSPSHRSVSRKQSSPVSPKDSYQRVSPLSPSPCRKDKCQSFPAHPGFAFYDNTSFGLTEAEQRMLDLPGYFGSNEEDETTSTLSVEKLVI